MELCGESHSHDQYCLRLHQKRLQAQREEEIRAKAAAEKQAAELAAQRAR